ncbi:LuxR C-terminal-related transcriptional regulator [Streptomyces sp. NPDC096198]|uniref:LuxR C-terminal-related transcriptional regulator n=1 Tax=Streptomyces sp. NPDC096198 TaxID=3366080 RepID=UPI003827C33A
MNRQVLAVLRKAADDIAVRSPDTAANVLIRALSLVGEGNSDRPQLLAETVRLLSFAGRLSEARLLGRSALRCETDDATKASVEAGLAEALMYTGRADVVVVRVRRALAARGVPDEVRASLLAAEAHGLLYASDVGSARCAAEAAVDLARSCDSRAALVFAILAQSVVARAEGRLRDSLSAAGEAVGLGGEARGLERHRHPRLWAAGAAAALDRFAEAESGLDRGQQEAEAAGALWSLPLWHCFRAKLRLAEGKFDQAEAQARMGLEGASRLTAHLRNICMLGVLAQIEIHRGNTAGAREHMRRVRQLMSQGLNAMEDQVRWELALVYDACGDYDLAARNAAQAAEALPGRLLLLTDDPSVGPQLVRMLMRAGAVREAERVCAAVAGLARVNPSVPSLAGAAFHAQGLLRSDADVLRAAVQAYRDSPRKLAAASALEDAAKAENAAGRRDTAAVLGQEALGVYSALGAVRAARRTEALVRSVGVGHVTRPRDIACRDAADWSALTRAERRVADLVTQGMTNHSVAAALSVSPHTVDSHLRKIFRKLGVANRVALTRLALHKDHGKR